MSKSWCQVCAFFGVDSVDDRLVGNISLDSRKIRSGDVFLALPGVHQHGIAYVAQVKAQGGKVISTLAGEGVDIHDVQLSERMGDFLRWFYDDPTRSIRLVGITGTNGKTSTCHYIAQWLSALSIKTAILGTAGNGVWGDLYESSHTTLDAPSLYRQLALWRDEGVAVVVMEVSSHAIDQQRIVGLSFAVVALTQVTRDHLDYHGNEDSYRAVKRRLFCDWSSAVQVLNAGDVLGSALMAVCDNPVSYGFDDEGARDVVLLSSDVKGDGFDVSLRVDHCEWQGHLPLFGTFNLENMLCALACVRALEVDVDQILTLLPVTRAVSGRMEWVRREPIAIVDYAHTPDALAKVLKSLRLHVPDGRLWLVFGAGGDRDAGKRPLMGQVALRYADHVVVTDDNPRNESPTAIAQDIVSGMGCALSDVYVANRAEAICRTLRAAGPNDVVLIAGKGHEHTQEIMGVRHHFSDVEVVLSCQ